MKTPSGGESGVHRKLAAIMFTDMVGYSALMQKDESLALALLDEQRALLRRLFPLHQGVEIETVGDAFLVEFDSAINAVRCAIDIQKSLHDRNGAENPARSIRLRVGIHLGDIVLRGGKVYGDGVNVASRIHSEAGPGQILVSEDVARQLRNNTEVRVIDIGKRSLKNIEAPLGLYRVSLSWAEERAHGTHRGGMRWRMPVRRLWIAAVVAAGLVVVSLLTPWTTGSGPRTSVGVLPLRNIGAGSEGEVFAEGMTEAISGRLAKIGGIRVSVPPSWFAFRESGLGWSDLAGRLGVETLLDGSTQRDGERIVVSLRLIDPATGGYLWSADYHRDFRDIVELQREIARGVAGGLEAQFFGPEVSDDGDQPAEFFEAYDLYMRGRYHWNRRSPGEITRAIDLFNEAVSRYPRFAPAYVGIADCYTIFGSPEYGVLPPAEAYPKAEEAVRRALEIDETLAEAHATLGSILFNYEWNWPEAERHFLRAIELNPNDAATRMWYGDCLTALGRSDEARESIQKALFLEPLNLTVRTSEGVRLYFARQYDSAVTVLRQIREMDPAYVPVYLWLSLAHGLSGRGATALETIDTGVRLSGGSPVMLATRALLEAREGDTAGARAIVRELELLSKQTYVSPYYLGEIRNALGETGAALSLFGQAVREKSGAVLYMKVSPTLSSLRGNAEFNRILRSAGME